MLSLTVLADAQNDRTQDLVTTTVFTLVALMPIVLIAVLEFLDRDIQRWSKKETINIFVFWANVVAYIVAVGGAITGTVLAFTYMLGAFGDDTAFLWIVIAASIALLPVLAVSVVRLVGSTQKFKRTKFRFRNTAVVSTTDSSKDEHPQDVAISVAVKQSRLLAVSSTVTAGGVLLILARSIVSKSRER